MKKLNWLISCISLLSLGACATSSNSPPTLDPNNDYRSSEVNSPNVGSKAYSGAEFPAENELTNPAH